MAKTNAERQSEDRAKKRANGYKWMGFWIKPEWKSIIVKLLSKLRNG